MSNNDVKHELKMLLELRKRGVLIKQCGPNRIKIGDFLYYFPQTGIVSMDPVRLSDEGGFDFFYRFLLEPSTVAFFEHGVDWTIGDPLPFAWDH